MRVAHIAYLYGLNNTGGACMAASRLHLALLRNGIESHFICCQQKEAGPNVHELPARGLLRAIQYVMTRIVWVLGYLTPERRIIMPNLVPLLTLKRTLRKIKPDIVHIHWYMMDTISFGQLANMPCPVVMTMHDMFDVSAGSPCPGEDTRHVSGLTPANSTWTERWIFSNKLNAMRRKHPVMIGPSRWICQAASASIIGRDLRFHRIGNIYDSAFRLDRSLRKPSDKLHILFGANGGRRDPNKGWDDFVRALGFLDDRTKSSIDITVFGEAGAPYVENGVAVQFAGIVGNAADMSALYNSADIAVVPSRIENAPNVKFEAWLCGLPVIVFNRTGCAEFVDHGTNGWVADSDDFGAFARGIEHFNRLLRENKLDGVHDTIAAWAASTFTEESILNETISVYKTTTA